MNNFTKLNQKYLKEFKNRVINRYKNDNIKTDTSFLRSIFKELGSLFSKVRGRLSSKSDIPKSNEYPDSTKFNKLMENIGIDLDKLYTAHSLLEDDVNNVLNFNSMQRVNTYENLTDTQQKVYSTYIKNKKLLDGSTKIPAESPFRSSDNLSEESENVVIENGRLSLSYKSSINKPVNVDHVECFFTEKPNVTLYPNQNSLLIGSHWKLPKKEAHFDRVSNYRDLMIDDKNNNMGVGHCEFEGVITRIDSIAFRRLRSYIGNELKKDEPLIYVNLYNSLQGKYSNTNIKNINTGIKLSIPFTSDAPLTNQISIEFQCPDGNVPDIDFEGSKIYEKDTAYSFIKSDSEDGLYKLIINNAFIKPTRAEIILKYKKEHWLPVDFYMSRYTYSANKNYQLSHGDNNINLILSKSYDIFVDTEIDENSEKSRALRVL